MVGSLRAKSLLALAGCISVVLVLTAFVGDRSLRSIDQSLRTSFVRNATRLNKQRVSTPVVRELALAQRLADSEVTRRWMLDEGDKAKRELFFAEAERYRGAFSDHSYFAASGRTGAYYFSDGHGPLNTRLRYHLTAGNPKDAWFYRTLRSPQPYNLNVDTDRALGVTKVWMNVAARDGRRDLGVVGTGLDLTRFLNQFTRGAEGGVHSLFISPDGTIQAQQDRDWARHLPSSGAARKRATLFDLLSLPGDRDALRRALQAAARDPESAPALWVKARGDQMRLAASFIPELNWYAITMVSSTQTRGIDPGILLPLVLTGGVLLVSLVATMGLAMNRILLRPLGQLTESARVISGGSYDVALPAPSRDELGDLTRAFGSMLAQVRSHTDDLEARIRERTGELVALNGELAAVNGRVADSIQYASMIQTALLPEQSLARTLGDSQFVLWRPRDVIGGDLYVFRSSDSGFLIGVVDCAGHGVPGACMTMLAHSILSLVIDRQGIESPASLLREMDSQVRSLFGEDRQSYGLARDMEAALVWVDQRNNRAVFSGAKIPLYRWSEGRVEVIRGSRRSIGGKRKIEPVDVPIGLSSPCGLYLTTDGLLDQAGGAEGFSLGSTRFTSLIERRGSLPLTEQRAALEEELRTYQGALPQRDDITVVGLRLPGRPASLEHSPPARGGSAAKRESRPTTALAG
ncbi:MAG TPA: biofilm regulation protein phosphatase SiaA [Armatimonadota bacterium]|jgi:serine phosphatase RsbU (regulator of sigma subunit)